MDVLWRARLLDATTDTLVIANSRSIARQALEFGTRMANHRVRFDAFLALAELADRESNAEASCAHYADAMKIAVRFGFNLHRSRLRISMGRGLVLQGEKSGIFLIRRGIETADRMGYQGAVEAGQAAIVELEMRNLLAAEDMGKYRD